MMAHNLCYTTLLPNERCVSAARGSVSCVWHPGPERRSTAGPRLQYACPWPHGANPGPGAPFVSLRSLPNAPCGHLFPLGFPHLLRRRAPLCCWNRSFYRLALVPPEDREQSPCGDWFVRSSKRRGLLPEILEELLAARKRWAGWIALASAGHNGGGGVKAASVGYLSELQHGLRRQPALRQGMTPAWCLVLDQSDMCCVGVDAGRRTT
jgi:hypothetical protein